MGIYVQILIILFQVNAKAEYKKEDAATLFDLFKTPRLAKNTILLVFFW